MDKKELINKIINKLKKFKKNKLIDIYNNYFNNFIKGGTATRRKGQHRGIFRSNIIHKRPSSAEQIATRRPPPPTTKPLIFPPSPPTTEPQAFPPPEPLTFRPPPPEPSAFRQSPPPRTEQRAFRSSPPTTEPQAFPPPEPLTFRPPPPEPSAFRQSPPPRTEQRAFRSPPPRTETLAFRQQTPKIQQQSQAFQYQSNQPKSGITTHFFQKDKNKFYKLTTKFNEFEKNYKFHELYDKEITYQHTYDSFRIFTVLKHMYRQRTHFPYSTDTLQIFQTLDKYYIKDLLIFVKNYFTKDAPKISFTYNIRNNKIYFKLNKLDGIMIYNMPFNTLDIRVKNEHKTPLTQNIPIVDKKTQSKPVVNEQKVENIRKRVHSQ